jgi:hypothetical protein
VVVVLLLLLLLTTAARSSIPRRQQELVDKLLELGMDPRQPDDRGNKSALQVAAGLGLPAKDIFNLLKGTRAPPAPLLLLFLFLLLFPAARTPLPNGSLTCRVCVAAARASVLDMKDMTPEQKTRYRMVRPTPPATTSHHQPPPATTSHHQPPPAQGLSCHRGWSTKPLSGSDPLLLFLLSSRPRASLEFGDRGDHHHRDRIPAGPARPHLRTRQPAPRARVYASCQLPRSPRR